MNFNELQDPDFAIEFLANNLVRGTLVLFLGAGTSKGFGLPNWIEFANSFRNKVGLTELSENSFTTEIQEGIDEAIDELNGDEKRKIQIVSEILYPVSTSLDLKEAYKNHLLISISSLLIGSKRGHVKRIVTFNYDSMLEWFLKLFGFQAKSIFDLPSLEGSEDIRIYHPHGFVPHPSLGLLNSKSLVLGMQDANKRVGQANAWTEKYRQLVESGICLFIGLSINSISDRAIGSILTTTADKVKGHRPLGIWISKDSLKQSDRKKILRNQIAPIEIQDEDRISEFILKISQKALEDTLI